MRTCAADGSSVTSKASGTSRSTSQVWSAERVPRMLRMAGRAVSSPTHSSRRAAAGRQATPTSGAASGPGATSNSRSPGWAPTAKPLSGPLSPWTAKSMSTSPVCRTVGGDRVGAHRRPDLVGEGTPPLEPVVVRGHGRQLVGGGQHQLHPLVDPAPRQVGQVGGTEGEPPEGRREVFGPQQGDRRTAGSSSRPHPRQQPQEVGRTHQGRDQSGRAAGSGRAPCVRPCPQPPPAALPAARSAAAADGATCPPAGARRAARRGRRRRARRCWRWLRR